MAALKPQTVMFGNPPTPGHKPSKSDLADWMQEVESLAVGGGLSYVNATLAALDARVGVLDKQFGLVLSAADEAGVYERVAGVWSKVAGVPAIFVENQAAAQILAARDEVVAAALAVALNASTALAAAEASGLAAFFDSKSGADAGLAGLAEGQLIEVLADETQSGLRARYRVEAGALVFKLAIGGMRADQNLAELADKDAALGILGLTSKGKALVKAATAAAMRTVLELKAGALAALADQPKAEAGTDNTTLMTPLRTKQAITSNLASSALGRLYAVVTDTKAQGTSGQAHTANTWTDHDINTVDYDPDSVVTLSAPSFQFDRDGYVKISTTQRDNQAIRLIEVTGSVVVTAGSSLSSSAASAGHAPAVGIYEVAADTDYRLQFIHNTSNLAPAVNFAGRAEVFLLVEFYA